MNKKHTIISAIFISGLTAIISQIIFLREFLVIFDGNEVSLGIFYGIWFFCGSLGGYFSSKFSDRLNNKIIVLSVLFFLISIFLPAAFIFLRAVKNLMQLSTGEIAGYASICTAGALTLLVPCAIFAFKFGLGCRVLKEVSPDSSGHTGKIYMTEALGALAGGIIVSLLLLKRVYPLETLLFLTGLDLSVSLILSRYSGRGIFKRFYYLLLFMTAAALVIFIFSGGVKVLREYSLKKLWGKYTLLSSRDSIYGNVALTEKEGLFSFYENGNHLFSVPDRFSSEEKVHLALLEHPDPENILLIGGGAGGAIEEILKYKVKNIDYVELDPLITDTAKEYLPEKYIEGINDPRVRLINADGRFFIKNTRDRYDCILINVGDPLTIQLNRFYTLESFREMKDILKPDGIVAFSLLSSENYLGEDLKAYLSTIYRTASSVFDDIVLIPGNTVYFLLSGTKELLTTDHNVLVSRLKDRGISNDYIREYYLFDRMSEERTEQINGSIQKFQAPGINRDFHPVAYYYAMRFWETQLDKPFFNRIAKYVTSLFIWSFAGIWILFSGLMVFPGKHGSMRRIVLTSVMITGFTEIVFQVVIMISFQAIYGYIYYKAGLIASFFMAGLACGGWIITKIAPAADRAKKMFLWTQCGIFLAPLVLIAVFFLLPGTKDAFLEWAGRNVVFLVLPFICGFFGGMHFVLANRICRDPGGRTGKVAGLTYSLDLFGACIGAFAASIILVPVIGIISTCLLTAVINAFMTIFYLISLKREVFFGYERCN